MHLSKRTLVIFSVIVAMLVGGVATAAWLSTGTGPARGQAAATAQALTVTARSGPADLYPGATGAVYFTVANSNPYAVTLSTVSYGVISGGGAGCVATDVTNIVKAIAAPTTLTPALVVPANGSIPGTIAGALTMPLTAANACQGVTFDIQITVSGVSS